MRAIVYTRYGTPDVLKLTEIEKPVPKKGELLVKVAAAAVTSGDVRMRKADPFLVRAFNGISKPKNKILGINFAGTVEAVGDDVKNFNKGDEVFGSTAFGFGAYAEYLVIPEDGVVTHKPAGINFEEAASVPFGALTSLHFLRQADLNEESRVLIYGASGALGTAAVQLAKIHHSDVTGVCGPANLELVKSLGADTVVDYMHEDFSKTGVTYDVIFDTVGKSPFTASLRSLDKNGYYLRAVHISPVSLARGAWTNFTTGIKVIGGVSKEKKEDIVLMKTLIEGGKFRPVVDKVFPFEKVSDAHEYVEKGHKKGNVVLKI